MLIRVEHHQQRLSLAVKTPGKQLLGIQRRVMPGAGNVTRVPGSSHACGRPCMGLDEWLHPARMKVAASAAAHRSLCLIIVFFSFYRASPAGEQESGENTADQHNAKTADGLGGAEDQHAEGQQGGHHGEDDRQQ